MRENHLCSGGGNQRIELASFPKKTTTCSTEGMLNLKATAVFVALVYKMCENMIFNCYQKYKMGEIDDL